MQPRRYPIELFALIASIAIVNLLAEVYYWYWRIWWFDIPMHFLGGVWLAGTALWLVYGRKGLKFPSFPRVLAVCLIFAFGVGLLWEMFEAGLGLSTVGHMNAMPDTLSDLLFDTIGGTSVAILVSWRMSQKNKN